MIEIKRAYEPAEPSDGMRILVDRVWPRGLSKQVLHLDGWLKDVAPSTALRKWFAHDPEKWGSFQQKYFAELNAKPAAIEPLLHTAKAKRVTLVYGAKDPEHNNARALKTYLEDHLRRR